MKRIVCMSFAALLCCLGICAQQSEDATKKENIQQPTNNKGEEELPVVHEVKFGMTPGKRVIYQPKESTVEVTESVEPAGMEEAPAAEMPKPVVKEEELPMPEAPAAIVHEPIEAKKELAAQPVAEEPVMPVEVEQPEKAEEATTEAMPAPAVPAEVQPMNEEQKEVEAVPAKTHKYHYRHKKTTNHHPKHKCPCAQN